MQVQTRTRYNCWDLLGDVGGFHDGLGLVASLFMGFIAQMTFQRDYTYGKLSEGLDNQKGKSFQASANFNSCVSRIDEGGKLEPNHIKLLQWAVQQTQRLKHKLF